MAAGVSTRRYARTLDPLARTRAAALGVQERRLAALDRAERRQANTRVVRSLLSDLVERGLDAERARLWVIDGVKALRKAIVECFGRRALVQRCQEHERRNVVEHLPEHLQAGTGRAMRYAWHSGDAARAKKQLLRLALARGAAPGCRGPPARRTRLDA